MLASGFAQESVWQRRDRLQDADLRSAAFWLRKEDPRYERFTATDKLPVDSTYSVLLVDASPDWRKLPEAPSEDILTIGHFGVFVVYGKTNQVYMVLDLIPKRDFAGGGPELEEATADTVLVRFGADYGLYMGSLKYVYDLPRRKLFSRLRFVQLGLLARAVSAGALYYAATAPQSAAHDLRAQRRDFLLAIQHRPGEPLPAWRLVDCASPEAPAFSHALEIRGNALVLRRDSQETAWSLPALEPLANPPPAREPPLPEPLFALLPWPELSGASPRANLLTLDPPAPGARWILVSNRRLGPQAGGPSGL